MRDVYASRPRSGCGRSYCLCSSDQAVLHSVRLFASAFLSLVDRPGGLLMVPTPFGLAGCPRLSKVPFARKLQLGLTDSETEP